LQLAAVTGNGLQRQNGRGSIQAQENNAAATEVPEVLCQKLPSHTRTDSGILGSCTGY